MPSLKIPDNINTEIHKNKIVFSSESPDEIDILKIDLVNQIANFIETKYKDALISRELFDINHFTKEELLQAADYIKKQPLSRDFNIKEKLTSFFEEFSDLSLEGFVNFRLKSYKDEIKTLALNAADTIIAEREYGGFLSLLSAYISSKPPLFDVLHIIVTECGGYYVLDENHHDITLECANAIAKSLMSEEIGFDEIILCILILTAPKKTVIHGANHIKCVYLTETVKKIFGSSAVFCGGCPLCDKYI